MKRTALVAGGLLVLLLAGVGSLLRAQATAEPVAQAAAGPASAQAARQAGTVSIDEAGRARIDLATAVLVPIHSEGTLAVQGRVLDPIPLVDAVLARSAARAAYDPARRELERVRELSRGDQNASQRELEAAEAASRRAQTDLDAAQARLVASFGVELAAREDLAALVARLVSRKAALARVDLPAGVSPPGPPEGVQLHTALGSPRELEVTLIGAAATTDPLLQALGFLVLIEREPPAPGTALDGVLAVPSLARSGLRVPEDAVVRHDGGAFVYVERSRGVFERRAIALESALPDAWLASGAIAAGEAVVVRGAQELLSSERGSLHAGE